MLGRIWILSRHFWLLTTCICSVNKTTLPSSYLVFSSEMQWGMVIQIVQSKGTYTYMYIILWIQRMTKMEFWGNFLQIVRYYHLQTIYTNSKIFFNVILITIINVTISHIGKGHNTSIVREAWWWKEKATCWAMLNLPRVKTNTIMCRFVHEPLTKYVKKF